MMQIDKKKNSQQKGLISTMTNHNDSCIATTIQWDLGQPTKHTQNKKIVKVVSLNVCLVTMKMAPTVRILTFFTIPVTTLISLKEF